MKKKLWIIVALVAALLVGGVAVLFGGGQTDAPALSPESGESQVTVDPADLEYAVEYLRTFYKSAAVETPGDYKRICSLRVGLQAYTVTWSVDADEAYVKVVPNDDGTVLIDVNENSDKEVAYVLTATITDAAGNSITTTWDHILPGFDIEEMQDIVDQAYALAEGAALEEAVTLRGTITSINTPYDSSYKNISVVIEITGREDKPILCYRLKGEGADTLAVGDIITVTGIIKNYKGTIEFDAGCTLDSVVKGENEAVVAPEDPAEIMKQAYALLPGQSLPYNCTLTGTITSVDEAYSTTYNNITVTMVVKDSGGYKVKCFRMKGADVQSLNVNDIITVTGQITNYKGTIEFGAGCSLDSVTQMAAPSQPSDPKKVVDEAYKLGHYESLPYTATLTGKVTDIKYRWSVEYPTVSLTMVVEGRENKPLYCYSMDGDVADLKDVEIGDTVTVKGMIKNYYNSEYGTSTIEYDHPTLLKLVKNTAVAPNDPKQIVDEAFALESGEILAYKATLTGEITKINTPYSSQYSNITVTIKVEGSTGMKNLMCYRLAGAGASKLAVGDTITVTGNIKNYNGTIEFDQGCTLDKVVKGEEKPVEPETSDDPIPGSVLTVADAVALGASKEHSTYTEGKYYVTGVVEDIYSTEYGNMHLVDEDGNDLTIYGLYSEDGSVRYDKMEEQPQEGDTITVYGALGQYNGTAQMKNAWLAQEPEGYLSVEDAIAMGTAMEHNTYTEEKHSVVGVITEITNATYGNMKIADHEGNELTIYGTYGADGEDRYDALETKPAVGDIVTIYGIVGQYNGTAQIKDGWITTHIPAEGEEEPGDSEEPDADSKLTIAEAIAMGGAMEHNTYTEGKYYVTGEITEVYNTQYGNMKIKDAEGNILTVYGTWSEDGTVRYDALEVKPVAGDTVTLYGIIGQYNGTPQMKNGWIIRIGEEELPEGYLTIAEAIAMGGAMEHNTYTDEKYSVTGKITEVYNTQYGNMKLTDEDGNILTVYGTYSADGSVRYDAMEVKPVVGDTVTVYGIVGQYNGTPQIKNGWITEHTAAGNEDEEPEVSTDPEADSVLTIAEAVALGKSKAHNTYTAGKYYVTGVVSDIYSTIYGNMHLLDENGNDLTVYGLYNEDGSVRFDAMEVQPQEGDTITVYGIIGQYNGTPQMKNGWLVVEEEEEICLHENLVHQEAVAPGCHRVGHIEHWYCLDCESVWQDEALTQLTNHKNVILPETGGAVNYVAAVTPSCYSEGKIDHWYCELCGQVWQDEALTQLTNFKNVILPATHQNLVHVEAVAPTATENGNIEHWYCEDCQTFWQDEALMQLTNRMNVILPATGEEEPDVPVTPEEPENKLTVAEALAMGSAMEHNTYTEEKYYVTGVITEVYQTTYGNMKITDREGNVLVVYGTYSADGEIRYDAMEVKPVAGDTVTVYGIIGQYNSVAQIKNGWLTEHIPAEDGGETEEPEDPEVPADPEADSELTIAEAIALGSGKEHNTYTAGKYYVTGVITEVYQTTYGNMKLTDEEGNILTVYGTWSEDGTVRYDALGTKPVAGDTVTLYGIIGQYNGTPQMKNGWIVPEKEEETPENQLTIAEAIAMGSAMEHNTYTEVKYSVTGVITEVYNTQYGNMKLTDEDGNILTVYGTWSEDGTVRYDALETKPVVGDTVTVYGIVGQYNGTPQIKNGWITEHTPAEDDGEDEEPEVSTDPEADSVLTIAEAVALGASKDHNTYTAGKYYVTGVITEVYNTTYGNMYITDAEGNILTVYGTYDADGTNRYDAMEEQPVAGDTVTVYGIIGQYNGTPQMKNGWVVSHTAAAVEAEDDIPVSD